MSVKPFRSNLIPYERDILEWRHLDPPMTYAEIAKQLKDKYGFTITRAAIFKFIKVRAVRAREGRKDYIYNLSDHSQRFAETRPLLKKPNPGTSAKRKPVFDYQFSDRYNLTRITQEEADKILNEPEEEEK